MISSDALARPLATVSDPETETRPQLTTRELFARTRKLAIEHDGQVYTLQLTRQNRLLLTK